MASTSLSKPASTVPPWIKWAFTAFMLVLVPVYWANYGPTNFLYFCDASLFLTLIAVWCNAPLPASMAAVGLLIPQIFWCVDFGAELMGFHLTHMTSYMFDPNKSLFLRGLSFFHGWLPFILVYLVWRLGYDRRGLLWWTVLAWTLCLIAYFLLPAAGAPETFPNMPRNVNYVFGTDDAKAETLMSPHLYLVVWMLGLALVFYVPTHFLLKRLAPAAPSSPIA